MAGPSTDVRWAPAVPALQLGVVATYAVSLYFVSGLPDRWIGALFYGAPAIFGAAWGLGWLVQRRRGAHKPSGGEYLTATLGQVLMGFGTVVSAALVVWLVTAPPFD